MDKYPIKPSDIDATKPFFNAFGKEETENAARHLVRMSQKNGDWRSFTQEEIDTFSAHRFNFNLLTEGVNPAIKVSDDRIFSFTHKFVASCFLASPLAKLEY